MVWGEQYYLKLFVWGGITFCDSRVGAIPPHLVSPLFPAYASGASTSFPRQIFLHTQLKFTLLNSDGHLAVPTAAVYSHVSEYVEQNNCLPVL